MPGKNKAGCFWIYILQCGDGSYYTGYTNNLARRYRLHVEGKAGVRYTRSRRPVRIAQCWRLFGSVGTALKVEHLVKKRPRAAKSQLVSNPTGLKALARAHLNRDIRIYTADPAAVETESEALTREDLRSGFNPFAGAPPADA